MKKIALFITILFSPLISIFANKIYLIQVIDAYSYDIKTGANIDRKNILQEFQVIDKGLDAYHLVSKTFALDQKIKGAAILDYLEIITPSKKDVVVFYYSGHAKNYLPELRISKTEFLSVNKIKAKLQSKKSRLNLIITDCCAKPEEGTMKTKSSLADLINEEMYKERMEALFKVKGNYLMMGTSKNESGITTDKGSYFTNCFINAIRGELLENDGLPNWIKIFKTARTNTYIEVGEKHKITQTPSMEFF